MASRRSSRRSSIGVNNDDTHHQDFPATTTGRTHGLGIHTTGGNAAPARPNALRRTSSSAVTDRRSSSPGLVKKASTGSLRNESLAAPGTPHRGLRRSSSQMAMSSPVLGSRSPLAPQVEEELPPPPTAASIAAQHFVEEMALHESEENNVNTLVVLHDACYGHRYSRPKTSKTTLSMIVERPERIHAGILGITSAYVRMGERHDRGRNAPHPQRSPSGKLPFKIRRTKREVAVTSPVVTNVHGTSWMGELKSMCDAAGQKLATSGKELERPGAASRTTGQPAKAKLHEGDLYLCTESLAAFQGALGGVCDGIDAVFTGTSTGQGPKTAFVCVRPPGHHCSADYPSGFCWLNNVHVGIEYATQTYGLTHAAIIDFDLHHGDGSQSMTWEHNDRVAKMGAKVSAGKKTSIGYFSLHDINSYPCEYGDIEKVQSASLCIEGAHNQTIWNVHLQPWKTEDEFWQLYETRYKVLLDKTRAFLQTHTARLGASPNGPVPKAAIFLSAGFDASEWESQGMQRHKVNVPTEFYARLTADVVKLSKEMGLAVDGRIVSVLEGGYSDRALTSGVLSHLSGLCHDSMAKAEEEQDQSGLAWDMGKRMAALALGSIEVKMEDDDTPTKAVEQYNYRPEWWQSDILTELEALTGSQPPVPQPKKPPGSKFAPTFASPTQSFTAKVVDPTKIRQNSRSLSSSYSRPVTPPIPEVDWATAAHELYKLLVPTNRTTKSCRPEELADTKAKRARQSDIGVITQAASSDATVPSGRELRVRKTKAPAFAEGTSDNESVASKRSVSRSDRRKTIADFPIASEPTPRPTSRPPSTVGRPPSAVGMNVKKTRGMPGDAAATNAPPPVPRVPSAFADRKPSPASATRPTAVASNATTGDGAAEDPMSAITTGLQRIKIKVPTDEERAARDAKRKADAAAAAVKKPAAPAAKAPARKAAAPKVARAPKAAVKKGAVATATLSMQTVDATPVPIVAGTADVPVVAPQPEAPLPPHPAETLQQHLLPTPAQPALTIPPVDPLANHGRPRSNSSKQVVPPPLEHLNSSSTFPYPSPPHENLPVPPPPVSEDVIEQVVAERSKGPTPNRPDTPPPPPVLSSAVPVALPQTEAAQYHHQASAGAIPPPSVNSVGPKSHQPALLPVAASNAAATLAAPPPPARLFAQPPPAHNAANPLAAAATMPTAPLSPPGLGRPDSRGRVLPNFTSSSAIPFAGGLTTQGRAEQSEEVKKEEKSKEVDIWEVPETPQKR